MKKSIFFLLVLKAAAVFCSNSQKPLVILVTSYNNAEWYQKNLSSVFSQNYDNYRVIYCDDCSSDGTAALVEQYVKECNQEHRFTLIKNENWVSQLANQYIATHMCRDEEIIVILDGDDWFKHENVFNDLNTAYQNSDVWCTHGRMELYPAKVLKPIRDIPKEVIASNTFRESHGEPGGLHVWNWWHPRTYYAWLAKLVELKDLMLQSSFKALSPSPDSAYMYPILEMSGFHTKYIQEVAYVKNKSNPISQDKLDGDRQFETNRLVASWKKYVPLLQPKSSPCQALQNSNADLIIFSRSLNKTEKLIVSTLKYTTGIRSINVVFSSTEKNKIEGYKKLAKDFSSVQIYNLKSTKQDMNRMDVFFEKLLDHILIADSNNIFVDSIDIRLCIQELEKTFATSFCLSLKFDQNYIPTYAPISNEVGAWQFNNATKKWALAYNFDMTLYKKEKLLEVSSFSEINDLINFKNKWLKLNHPTLLDRNIGLFLFKTVCTKV